jgi:phthiodiolone/phenolphthiodiolone dimycocerosates ketoreductase
MSAKRVKTTVPIWTNRYLPPTHTVAQAKELEASGVVDDVVIWDQMSSWWPKSLWNEENSPLARMLPDYDSFPDAYALSGYVAAGAPGLGLTVTIDSLRQGPGELLRAMLTLANITEGRTTFTIGAGEIKQCKPFGWKRSQGLSRMEDHFRIYREFLSQDGPISFEGNHWKLDRAWLGNSRQNLPKFWGMGGGPKLIDYSTSYADGLSTALPCVWSTPERTRAGIEEMKRQLADKGRDPDDFAFGGYTMMLIHEDRDVIDRALENPLIKWAAAIWGRLNMADWHEEGMEPPFPEGWHYAMKLLPTHMGQAEVDEALSKVTRKMAEKSFVIGSPQEVAEQMQAHVDEGLTCVIPLDILQTVLHPDDAELAPGRGIELAGYLKNGIVAPAVGAGRS